jgi:hypothetical protein
VLLRRLEKLDPNISKIEVVIGKSSIFMEVFMGRI